VTANIAYVPYITASVKVTIDKTSGNCVGHLPHKKVTYRHHVTRSYENRSPSTNPVFRFFNFTLPSPGFKFVYPSRHKDFSDSFNFFFKSVAREERGRRAACDIWIFNIWFEWICDKYYGNFASLSEIV